MCVIIRITDKKENDCGRSLSIKIAGSSLIMLREISVAGS